MPGACNRGEQSPRVCPWCGTDIVYGICIMTTPAEGDAVCFCCEDHLDAWVRQEYGCGFEGECG